MNSISYSSFISLALQYSALELSTGSKHKIYPYMESSEPMGFNIEFESHVHPEAQYLLKDIHEAVAKSLDHQFVNELKEFKKIVPTFERLALFIYNMSFKIANKQLVSIKIRVPEFADIEVVSSESIKLSLFNQINCVHRHHNPDLTANENKELYGKCSGVHGHEYKIELKLSGEINADGEVFCWQKAHEILQEKIISKFNKTYLNDKMGNTSGELIIKMFHEQLSNQFPPNLKMSLALRETLKNSFFI